MSESKALDAHIIGDIWNAYGFETGLNTERDDTHDYPRLRSEQRQFLVEQGEVCLCPIQLAEYGSDV
jgi:hypothetical protein